MVSFFAETFFVSLLGVIFFVIPSFSLIISLSELIAFIGVTAVD